MANLYQKLTARLRGGRGRAAELEQIGAARPSPSAFYAPAPFDFLSVPAIRPAPKVEPFCGYCGGKLPASALKCQNCGGPVERDQAPRPELPARTLGPAPHPGALPAGLSYQMLMVGAILLLQMRR